jgi:hypothetical protein
MNADIVIDLGMGKSGKSDKHKYGRVSREVDWSDESSIQDYFDSVSAKKSELKKNENFFYFRDDFL